MPSQTFNPTPSKSIGTLLDASSFKNLIGKYPNSKDILIVEQNYEDANLRLKAFCNAHPDIALSDEQVEIKAIKDYKEIVDLF